MRAVIDRRAERKDRLVDAKGRRVRSEKTEIVDRAQAKAASALPGLLTARAGKYTAPV